MLTRIARTIASNPMLYQWIQAVGGQRHTVRQLALALSGAALTRTLDVGSAGGGTSRGLLGKSVSIDVDLVSLLAMKRSHPGAAAVAGGIGALPFGNSSFPTAICVAVAHHLEASTLHRGLAEIARVVSGQFVFVDAVRIDGRWLSSILWRYDRGRFPRTRDELLAAIGQHFTIEKVVDYRFLHCYVLCVAKPLAAPAPDILLRPVEVDDAGRMLQWMQDPEVRFNLGVRREPSMERTIEWIRRSQQEKTIAARAIMMQGRHVGNVVLDQIDRATGSARLSIYIGAAGDRLGGIGRRAIALLLDEGFASLGLKKVWLSVAMDHSAAIRCYTAVGFRRERILQQRHFAGSEVKDCLLMVVLREDWWR